MQITFSELKKLPVYTQNGIYLGKVADAVLTADDLSVFQLKVRSHQIVGRVFLIHNSQVRAVSAQKIIVDDALSPQAGVVPAVGGYV